MNNQANEVSLKSFCIAPVYFISLVFFFGFFAQDFAIANGCPDSKKAEAATLYRNAKRAYEMAEARGSGKDVYLEIEDQLMAAIKIVHKDSENLRYEIVEKRILPGTGRWVEYYNVSIPYNRQYYPNRMLSEIREKYPPRPWVVINKIVSGKGETFLFEIENSGKTSLEYVKVDLNSSMQPKMKIPEIYRIHPGKSVTLAVPFLTSGQFRFSFKEKYNYVSMEMDFELAN